MGMALVNPEIRRSQISARRRFEARGLLDRLKDKPCHDCKEKFLPCQMDFIRSNGRPGKTIASMLLKSQETIIKETQKCILVCANCSRLRIWKSQREMRSEPT